MREILFRGQTRRKGEYVKNFAGDPCDSRWVYGGILRNADGDFAIIYADEETEHFKKYEKYVVYNETVGQFTGLTDKNGKRIFEDDILRYKAVLVRVSWDMRTCGFCAIDKQGYGLLLWEFNDFARTAKVECEIIGNIHDNPELLEVIS